MSVWTYRRRPGSPGFVVAAVLLAAGLAAAAESSATHKLADPNRSYEVLLPSADASSLAGRPTVLYLHAAGQPKPDRFRATWWPVFRERNCLVALPTSSLKDTWAGADAAYVMDVADDVQKRYRADPKQLILMGVSGGAQTGLFLADRVPERFRAVIVVSTNPLVVREGRYEWFYPPLKTARTCPYFVLNHITQGSALMFWRQVQLKRAAEGASLSLLPVVGEAGHFQPPPKEFAGWLDEVLAGKQPAALADPQKAAVAKMLAGPAGELANALASARAAAPTTQPAVRDGKYLRLSVPLPASFERSRREIQKDTAGRAITQVRIEHTQWPISVRCDARATDVPMAEVLRAEEDQTIQRGMLYQLYHTGKLAAGGRQWQIQIGSITYPDRQRGWVSALFLHAAAPIAADDKQWLELLAMDETHKPDAAELAGIVQTVAGGVQAGPSETRPRGAATP